MAAILDIWWEQFSSVRSIGLLTQEKKPKIDFQVGGHGIHDLDFWLEWF